MHIFGASLVPGTNIGTTLSQTLFSRHDLAQELLNGFSDVLSKMSWGSDKYLHDLGVVLDTRVWDYDAPLWVHCPFVEVQFQDTHEDLLLRGTNRDK